MTVLEASNNILRFFRDNDFATISNVRKNNFNVDQFKEPGNKEEQEELINDIYRIAFSKLCDLGYCDAVKGDATHFVKGWVLIKPLDYYPQVIEIEGVLAVSIAQVLNELAVHFKGMPGVDATKISTKDLENLTTAGYELLKLLKETNHDE